MPRLSTLLSAGLISLTATCLQPTRAAAYPVDCAILLCLAGGWPASAECVHARAVFIARITPWPIEPPLQIWNCPMRASFPVEARPMDRLFDIALRAENTRPLISKTEEVPGLLRVQDTADVDISGSVFDFVRSIRVFEITYQQHRNSDGDCNTWSPDQRPDAALISPLQQKSTASEGPVQPAIYFARTNFCTLRSGVLS